MSRSKHVGIVYAKDPFRARVGMDIIRWTSLSKALSDTGCMVDMITALGQDTWQLSPRLRVIPIRKARWERYDCIKSCYQQTIQYIPPHKCIIARLARVIGPDACSRDNRHLDELLCGQEEIGRRARIVLVNDELNRQRWIRFYGTSQSVDLLPTGCPDVVPRMPASPFVENRQIAIFMGTISNRRIVVMLNNIGRLLKKRGWQLVVVGTNKTAYYCSRHYDIDNNACVVIPSVPLDLSWQYLKHANVGLAIAPGPLAFENETSKLYYYLRVGLPVACEERISNADLVTDVKWGSVFSYGDAQSAADVILSLGRRRFSQQSRNAMIRRLICNHSWSARARTLKTIIDTVLTNLEDSGKQS